MMVANIAQLAEQQFRKLQVKGSSPFIGSSFIGAWRSLVARFVRDEEAAGSNPVAPTRKTYFPSGRKYVFLLCRITWYYNFCFFILLIRQGEIPLPDYTKVLASVVFYLIFRCLSSFRLFLCKCHTIFISIGIHLLFHRGHGGVKFLVGGGINGVP